ncbi:hypothetical protein BH11MYX1_BH11MYX1_43690 [soil metagenome]
MAPLDQIISTIADLGGPTTEAQRSHAREQVKNLPIAACIATVTAFAVVNASKVGLSSGAFVVWATPSALGGLALGRWIPSYRQRFLRPRADGALAGESRQVEPE